MTTYAWVPLAASIIFIPLFGVLLLNRPWDWKKNKHHRILFWYLLVSISWSFTDFLLRSPFFPEHGVLLVDIILVLSPLMAIQFIYVLRYFARSKRINSRYIYVIPLAVVALELLGYIPAAVDISTSSIQVDYGIWLLCLVFVILVIASRDVYDLIRRFLVTTDPEERNQTSYLFACIVILFLFGVSSFVPGASKFPLSHFGNFLVGLILTYVFLRHRLVDMKFVTRRGLVWTGLLVAGAGIYLVLYLIMRLMTGIEPKGIMVALATLGAILVSVAVYGLRGRFDMAVDRLFYRGSYDYRQKLFDFVGHKLTGVLSLKELGEGLLPLIARSLDCERIYLLLPKTKGGDFVVDFTEPRELGLDTRSIRIKHDSPVIEWLKHGHRYLTEERLSITPEFRSLWAEERVVFEKLEMELSFPVISRDSLVGVLILGRKNAGRYSIDDINLIETITNRVAASLEKEYLQEQLRKREAELTLINRLDRLITSSLNIRDVYGSFVNELKAVFDIEWATITWIEGDDVVFEALSTEIDSPWQAGDRVPLKGTVTEWIAKHKKAWMQSDLERKSGFTTTDELLKLGIRSIAYLPLFAKGSVIGSLVVASRRLGAYSREHVSLLERIALQIAVSLEKGKLYARAEERSRIDELTRLFNRRHFDESLGREIALQSRSGGVLSLAFLDLDHFKDYNDRYGHPDGDKILARVGLLIDLAIRKVDLAFRYGGDEFAIIFIGAAGKDALAVAERIRSEVATAMKDEQSGITASLGLASWPTDGVTSDEIVTAADRALYYAKRTGGNRVCMVSEMLPSLADHTAQGPRTEKEALSVIYALASTIEARDQYTYGHSRSVSRYAVALAESLGLPSDRVTVIGTAALLHDIGKIGIPDEVLNKRGALSADEWEMVQSHPRLSAAIVGHVPSLTPCLPGILHHQERWDGTGYPSGLRGESIPLEARILSVADAFEAMSSPRPYRDQMLSKDVLKELKRGAGKQFDPKLIDAFIPIALAMVPEEVEIKSIADSSK